MPSGIAINNYGYFMMLVDKRYAQSAVARRHAGKTHAHHELINTLRTWAIYGHPQHARICEALSRYFIDYGDTFTDVATVYNALAQCFAEHTDCGTGAYPVLDDYGLPDKGLYDYGIEKDAMHPKQAWSNDTRMGRTRRDICNMLADKLTYDYKHFLN